MLKKNFISMLQAISFGKNEEVANPHWGEEMPAGGQEGEVRRTPMESPDSFGGEGGVY